MNAAKTATRKGVATGSSRRNYTPRKRTNNSHRFAVEIFERLADDLTSGRVPLDRISVSDDQTPGLRALIRDTGLISYHVQYPAPDGSRPYLKIGDVSEITIEQARAVARTVWSLANKGVDVTAGLHQRLVRELQEKGDKWRP